MQDFLLKLFDTSDFPPRWHCGVWTSGHGWLHIASDLAIWAAYLAIPGVLAFYILRQRDVVFPRVFWLFCAFIFACGTTHLIEAGIFWWPAYRLSELAKLLTALVSWTAVVALVAVTPRVLELPGPAQWLQAARANAERVATEARLKLMNERLEQIVDEKTAEAEARAAQWALAQAELDRFNQLAVGRELRMIELKREVNALSQRLGEAEPYDLSFVDRVETGATA